MNLFVGRIASPVGTLALVWRPDTLALRILEFEDKDTRLDRALRIHCDAVQPEPARLPAELREPIDAYFRGDLTAIDSIPVETGGTEFQKRTWKALRTIPAGTTLSYGELARRIGSPSACRAVGLANGANPVAIVVPCHRVIGTSGALTGYGGGMERKRWLLQHEHASLPGLERQAVLDLQA